MSRNRSIMVSLAVILTMLTTGCAVASFSRLGPQTHFVYPNSNVKTLGPVKVTERGDLQPFLYDLRTGEKDRRLYEKALRQVQGANVVTDYVVTTKIIMYPFLYVTLYRSETELEGTAARMEVGKQALR